VRVPPEACGGARDVLAVCPEGTETARAAQDRDALLLRFASHEEARSPNLIFLGMMTGRFRW